MVSSQAVGLAVVIGVVAIRGTGAPALVRLLPAVGGGLAGIAALTGFYRALAIGTMSVVAPIAATGVSVPVVVGIARGDHPAASQLAGIVIAVIGVVLASREHGPGIEDRGASRASVALALLAAAGFGCYFVGVQSSARADPMWALLASRVAGVALLLVVAAVQGGIAVGAAGSVVAAGADGGAGCVGHRVVCRCDAARVAERGVGCGVAVPAGDGLAGTSRAR